MEKTVSRPIVKEDTDRLMNNMDENLDNPLQYTLTRPVEKKTGMGRPRIHEFLDYRAFLRALYAFKKLESLQFSFRNFSRLAGLKSSNFLKLVMDGKRNLSNKAIHQFARGFKLSREESVFFDDLVRFNQAHSNEEKNRCYERIIQTKSYHKIKKLEVCQYDYFSRWYHVAIRELVTFKNFTESPEWINKTLGTRLTHEEIRKAVKTLLELNLAYRGESGHLHQTDSKITVAPEIGSLVLINFQKEMIAKAKDALEKTPAEQRDIASLTIGLSKEKFEKIRDRIVRFRHEIHAMAADEEDPQAVYQLNLQFFNLSEVLW